MPVLHPHPTKPGKLVTRQTLWQIKQREAGLCVRCRAPRVNASHCRSCADKQAAAWKRWYREMRQLAVSAQKDVQP